MQRGQSTVEFGASALVLVLLLFGLIDLGRVFYYDVGLSGATREGARAASWFDPKTGTNPNLDDTDIKNAVDGILTHSGLPATQLQNSGGTTCPGNATTFYNPPYPDSVYPTSLNQPWLFICYSNTPGLDFPTTAPPGNQYNGSDVNVILVMSFGFASGFMSGILGNSVHIVANTHMSVGGF
jgi:Flp pilus assembly protein TadG